MKKPNYLLPILFIIVGIMVLIVSIYFDIKKISVDNHYLTIDNSKTVYLYEGDYIVFIDTPQVAHVSLQDNLVTISSFSEQYTFEFVVKEKVTNQIITVEKIKPNTKFEYNNNQGILKIKINQSGYYLIESQKDSDQNFGSILLISNVFNNMPSIFIAFAKVIAICGITGISALISFIIIYRKRKKYDNDKYIR
ncbi:hypothetical protein KHQ81_07825 [Mycoplasmatota bacterium]|nr:hypothetical protein KHQ81_07825 [Mycoplasmatota bacterium]